MRHHRKVERMIISLILIGCFFCSLYFVEHTLLDTNTSYESENNTVYFQVSEEVLLCSETSKQLYDNLISAEKAAQEDDPYRSMVVECYIGYNGGTLFISEEESFENALEYTLPPFSSTFAINNLKTDNQYYYKVVTGNAEISGAFQTVPSTRFVSMPNAINTRDIGGYTNLDGKKIRQGLLIRGSEIDGLVERTYILSDDAVSEIQNTFGFVYDFDLRAKSIFSGGRYRSPLGDGVGHAFYTCPQYDQIFDPLWQNNVRQIFSDLADKANYPMYMHCTYGKDRTGTIVFLLQGILNMSEEDMMREYYMSGYTLSDVFKQDDMSQMIAILEEYKGDTMAEKVVSFLTQTIGVSNAEIKAIREIFIEP